MDIVAALTADLHDLVVDLDHEAYTPGTLEMLKRDLKLAVSSSLGYSLTLEHDVSLPVNVHVIDEPLDLADVPGSLRVELNRFGPYVGGTVTFYASRAGAFSDLASDMGGVLMTTPEQLRLDTPLTGGWISPGIAGLTDFSQVNYAMGVLLGHGRSLNAAREELQRRAQHDNLSLPDVARTILYA